jgi:hypothetical protein
MGFSDDQAQGRKQVSSLFVIHCRQEQKGAKNKLCQSESGTADDNVLL